MKPQRLSAVIWFIGLSGSGKSTLSEALNTVLKEKGYFTEVLDGDVSRTIFKEAGFTRPERMKHLSAMTYIASLIERQETIVIGSFITPYEEARENLRKTCKNYIEVWVDTSLEVCEKRDVKGLYKKARKGEITSFTGISDPFEEPKHFDIRIKTEGKSVEQSLDELLKELAKRLPDLKV